MTDLSPTSQSCTAAPGGGRDCIIEITAPNGNDTFDVRLFDAANAGGNVLSRSLTTQMVSDSTQTINFTLNGVVSKVLLSPTSITIPAGQATTEPVSISALDADNSTIIAPGGYVDSNGNAITVGIKYADSLAATPVAIVGSPAASPGASQTLSYNGSSTLGGTVSATVSGTSQTITSNNVALTVNPSVIATATFPPGSVIYGVVVGSDHSLYAVGLSGATSAKFYKLTTPTSLTSYPIPVASGVTSVGLFRLVEGPDGRVWTSVLNSGNTVSSEFAAMSTTGVVGTYAAPTASPLPSPAPSPAATAAPFQSGFEQIVVFGTGMHAITSSPYGIYPLSTSGVINQAYTEFGTSGSQVSNGANHQATYDSSGVLYANDASSGTSAVLANSTVIGSAGMVDFATSGNGSAYSTTGTVVYKLSTGSISPVPMATATTQAIYESLAPGRNQDLWSGGFEYTSLPGIIAHIPSTGMGTTFGLPMSCDVHQLASDLLSGTLYGYTGSGSACNSIVTIVY